MVEEVCTTFNYYFSEAPFYLVPAFSLLSICHHGLAILHHYTLPSPSNTRDKTTCKDCQFMLI